MSELGPQLSNLPCQTLLPRSQASQAAPLADEVLLARIESGDEQAMASLFDRHCKVVYSVAYRVLHDPAAAEDIMQETFLQVWRNPSRFQPERGSLTGWLAIVSRNRSIDALRRKKPCDSLDDLVLTSPSDVDRECEHHLMMGKAQDLMQQLPTSQQRALEMAFFDGMTHAEIAEATGIPLGTIKSDIRRALLSIRKAAQV